MSHTEKDYPVLITLKEAAKRCGVHRTTIGRRVGEFAELTIVRINGHPRIIEAELNDFLNRRIQEAAYNRPDKAAQRVIHKYGLDRTRFPLHGLVRRRRKSTDKASSASSASRNQNETTGSEEVSKKKSGASG